MEMFSIGERRKRKVKTKKVIFFNITKVSKAKKGKIIFHKS